MSNVVKNLSGQTPSLTEEGENTASEARYDVQDGSEARVSQGHPLVFGDKE
jgi:hypothetical protein